MPRHPAMLVPVAPIAPRALLPDDPGVALRLATSLLEDGRLMANHHRGLWGYSGSGRDGLGPLTIQSTGIGASSAGLVLGELIEAGVTVAVRVGSGRSSAAEIEAGALHTVTEATNDGRSTALDQTLTSLLAAESTTHGPVHTSPAPNGDVHDLESAALAQLAAEAGIRLGAILVISATPRAALDHIALAERMHDAGVVAGSVLLPPAS